MEFLRFCPCNWGTRKASGYCSQSKRLLFGRDTRNLRRCFRGFVGGNRKSRRREAAGRRNYPEAVPNGEGRNGSYAPQQVPLVHLRKTEVHKEAPNAAVGRDERFESRSEFGQIPSSTKRTQEGDL